MSRNTDGGRLQARGADASHAKQILDPRIGCFERCWRLKRKAWGLASLPPRGGGWLAPRDAEHRRKASRERGPRCEIPPSPGRLRRPPSPAEGRGRRGKIERSPVGSHGIANRAPACVPVRAPLTGGALGSSLPRKAAGLRAQRVDRLNDLDQDAGRIRPVRARAPSASSS